MAKVKANADVFMQFAVVEATWPGVTTVLTEGILKTGLSIRGGIAWLIHMVQVYTRPPSVSGAHLNVCLCSIEGRTTMPVPTDKGTLEYFSSNVFMTTSGKYGQKYPHESHYLPPLPFAGPHLGLYIQTAIDDNTLDGSKVYARVGFTTQAVEAATFAELAEVWEHV